MTEYEIVSGKQPDGSWERIEPFLGVPLFPRKNGLSTALTLFDEFCREANEKGAKNKMMKSLTPKRILLSGNRTIVFWNDGTKTIVKQSPTEQYSVYAAFTAALAIKLYGSNSKLKKMIRDKVEVQKTKEPKPEPHKVEPPRVEQAFKPGCKVRMKNNDPHKEYPEIYPPMGTIGTLLGGSQVQWPKGSTSDDDIWGCPLTSLEVVED